MSSSQVARAAAEYIEQVWNAPDGAERLKDWLAPDYRDHAYADDRSGLERALQELRAAFPDATFEVEDAISDGDSAVLRMVLRGTHSGSFRGRPATGLPVEVKVFRWLRFQEGRVAEHWALLDTATLLRQLAS